MNSALYRCRVMHQRLVPKRHRFTYDLFYFWLDLDEIDEVAKTFRSVSHGRFNLYSYRDEDHLQRGEGSTRANLLAYLREDGGLTEPVGKIYLLTMLRTLGHIFNPVSFYFIYDPQGRPLGTICEVANTFRECKPYFLGADRLHGSTFTGRQRKDFYISPYSDVDIDLDFRLRLPGERLDLRVNDYAGETCTFVSALTGTREALTARNLRRATLRFPLVTLRILALIHWQGIKMLLRRFPLRWKHEQREHQRGHQRGPRAYVFGKSPHV